MFDPQWTGGSIGVLSGQVNLYLYVLSGQVDLYLCP